jgi:hypothetical protein
VLAVVGLAGGSAQARDLGERGAGRARRAGRHFQVTLGWPWWAVRLVALVLLGLQTACATGYPMGGNLGGGRQRWRVQRASPRAQEVERHAGAATPGTRRADEDREGAVAGGGSRRAGVAVVAERAEAPEQSPHRARRASAADLEGKGIGWPDGVGDGRPFEVPMTLDYF